MPVEDIHMYSFPDACPGMHKKGEYITLELLDADGSMVRFYGTLRWQMRFPGGHEECLFMKDTKGKKLVVNLIIYDEKPVSSYATVKERSLYC